MSLTRRELLRELLAAGLSVGAASTILAGCGGNSASSGTGSGTGANSVASSGGSGSSGGAGASGGPIKIGFPTPLTSAF